MAVVLQGARQKDVKCPHCPKHINANNLQQHIKLKHTEEGQRISQENGRLGWISRRAR